MDDLNLEKVRSALERGYGLPSHFYTNAAIFELERSRIFARNWLFFAHADQIDARPGSYCARTAGTYPIVIVRDERGSLKGFLNVCRHRLHKVVDDGCGTVKVLRCRYHGWSYCLDGQLNNMPRSSELFLHDGTGLDRTQHGLVPVQVQTWGSLVFVNVDNNATPLAASIGSLDGLAKERGLNFDVHPRWIDERIINANWKVFIDNVIECYHCPTVHPGLSESYDTASRAVVISCEGARCALGIPRRGSEYQETDPTQPKLEFHSYFMPPTMYASARNSDWLLLVITEPIDAHHSRVTTHFCFPKGVSDAEVKSLVDSGIQVNAEDFAVAESVQRGHEMGIAPLSYYLPHSEQQLRTFAAFVQTELARP